MISDDLERGNQLLSNGSWQVAFRRQRVFTRIAFLRARSGLQVAEYHRFLPHLNIHKKVDMSQPPSS